MLKQIFKVHKWGKFDIVFSPMGYPHLVKLQ
jgi:hypothetical protein